MIGTTISHFRIVEKIGAGGMGEVFRAEDLTLPRQVALKFLAERLTPDSDQAERFLREAQAASALDHPNICTIYEIGRSEDGRMYIAMPFYEGQTLRSRLNGAGALPPSLAARYAAGVADGLEKAHRKGILHRDIKPDNLMVTTDGIVKILDFGVAKLQERTDITTQGGVVGTVCYMSPEQVRGKELDARSDVFSLGTTLYECVTGARAFQGDNPASTIHQILFTEPASPRSLVADLPPALDEILRKALAKAPEARFQSMAELRVALGAVVQDVESAPTVPITRLPARRIWKWRHPTFLLIAALGLAAGLALVGGESLLRFLGFSQAQRDRGYTVLPFESPDGDASSHLLAAGVGSVLALHLARLAAGSPDVWSVPAARVPREATAETVKGRLGVDAVLTGAIERAGSGYLVECRLLESGSARLLATRRWSSAEPAGLDQFDDALRFLLDLPSPPAGPGGDTPPTAGRDPDAMIAMLSGFGQLAGGADSSLVPARTAFLESIAKDSLQFEAYLGLSETLLRTYSRTDTARFAEEALAAVDRAVRLDSTRAEGFLIRGRILARMNRKAEAVDDFARATELSPETSEGSYWLGRTLFELGRYEEAERTYREAITAAPRYWKPYEDLGYFYYAQGRYAEAKAPFATVTGLVPAHSPTYNYLGAISYALEEWDQAILYFEKSFALGKTYAACANLGTLYYMDRRFQDAVRMYELALEYDPEDYLTVGNLATAAYWIPEERDRAMVLFEQAIRMAETRRQASPEDPLLLAMLAGYYSISDPDQAVRCIEEALRLKPEDAEVLYRAALVYEFIGQRSKALVLVGKSLEQGYSRRVIEHERQLEELVRDPRYALFASSAPQQPEPGSGKGDDP